MYNLELSRDQLVVLQDALESYFRIRINQWDGLAEELASVGYVYDKKDPDNAKEIRCVSGEKRKDKGSFRTGDGCCSATGDKEVYATKRPDGRRYLAGDPASAVPRLGTV